MRRRRQTGHRDADYRAVRIGTTEADRNVRVFVAARGRGRRRRRDTSRASAACAALTRAAHTSVTSGQFITIGTISAAKLKIQRTHRLRNPHQPHKRRPAVRTASLACCRFFQKLVEGGAFLDRLDHFVGIGDSGKRRIARIRFYLGGHFGINGQLLAASDQTRGAIR